MIEPEITKSNLKIKGQDNPLWFISYKGKHFTKDEIKKLTNEWKARLIKEKNYTDSSQVQLNVRYDGNESLWRNGSLTNFDEEPDIHDASYENGKNAQKHQFIDKFIIIVRK